MAKKKNRRRRDSAHISRQRPASVTPHKRSPWVSNLQDYEDRRLYHPESAVRPAASFNRDRHRLVTIEKRYKKVPDATARLRMLSQTQAPLAFEKPEKVLICVRRKIRKEVLHALKKTGGRGGVTRKPIWNRFSEISCRRT